MISPLPSKASSTCRSRSVSPIAGNTSLTALSPPRNSSDRAISLPDSPTILAAEPIIAADAIKNLSVAASPNPRTPIAAALAASVSVASPRSADSPAEGKPRSFVQVALWAICLTTTVCVLVALWHGWSMVHAHRVSTASQVGSSTSSVHASTASIVPLIASLNGRTPNLANAVDLLGADFAAGQYKDESVGEPTDKRRDFDDDEIVHMMRKQEPRLMTVVASLEKSGRHFTQQMLNADGIYLKRVPGKGVGVFASRNFSVGDFVPSQRRFEEMHFEGCPPEISFKASCESDDMRAAIRPVACEVMGRFTCDRHTDRTSVRNIDAFISSYDWDLLINHGDDSARNVKTRHYRRDYASAATEPYRFVTSFQVIKPIAKDEELLTNYLLGFNFDGQCDENETLLECAFAHNEELPLWKPRRLPQGKFAALVV